MVAIDHKIPRGVILDLLDLYDLEIEILYIVVEYNTLPYQTPSYKPTFKLNYRFKELKDTMFSLLAKWQIPGWEKVEFDDKYRIKGTFYLPFYNLDLVDELNIKGDASGYESELDGGSPAEILTKMHATRKLIKGLLNSEFVDRNDNKRDEIVRDIIEGTKRILPEAIEEAKHTRTLRTNPPQPERVTKVEVVMPEMRNVEDNSVLKGKTRVYPPKFSSTAWPNVTIHFINEHDVFITAGAKSAQSNYKALGFEDAKRDTPNRAWQFLVELARNEGATLKLSTPIPDNTKQMKKQLSDGLMKIFDNATDPFHNPAATPDHVYRIKLNLIPPEAKRPKPITEEYEVEEPDLEEDEDGR